AAPAGETRHHARTVLVDALEAVAEVVASLVDGLAQQPLQPIPRSQDLRQVLFADHASIAIQGDSFLDLDAEVEGARAALSKPVQQLRGSGEPRAAADQPDRRALVDVGLPSFLPQERRGEEPRHGAADDHGAWHDRFRSFLLSREPG